MENIKRGQTSKQLTITPEKATSNEDLLGEILLRSPIISLLRLKSVSKNWYSLITRSNFSVLRQNTTSDPPCGLFLRRSRLDTHSEYDFVPLDTENPVKKPPFRTLTFDPSASCPFEILQSCNGLLLCHSGFCKFYIHNPTMKLSTTLPPLDNWKPANFRGMTMAFDPSKSSHYKVACVRTVEVPCCREDVLVQMMVYSSETGNWRVCGQPFKDDGFVDFKHGVYHNDTIHWIYRGIAVLYFKFEEEYFHYLRLESLSICGGERHCDYLVESCNRVLLVVIICNFEEALEVYELKEDYSGWSLKYRIDLHEFNSVLPEMVRPRRLSFSMLSLVVGEIEEDSFFVFEIHGKAIQYYILSKTCQMLCDITPVRSLSNLFVTDCFQFIPSLSGV